MDSAEAGEEQLEAKLREHLARRGLDARLPTWRLGASELGGRGLLAARPIGRGELVYADRALLLGPRCSSRQAALCAACLRGAGSEAELRGCELGCGLPVCRSACPGAATHAARECAYLRELRPRCAPGDWSWDLLRALVPLRGLFLPEADRRLLLSGVQCHQATRHGLEVELLKRSLVGELPSADEQLMRRVCQAMDTNAFETASRLQNDDEQLTSLRGLFPLGALTNHQCVPNTRHLVNAAGELRVYASRPIAEGQEVSMSYAELLWDSPLRRQFLRATKHFECRCPRCCDPTEHGSLLAALRCADADCQGRLLPEHPLQFTSPWSCSHCRLVVRGKQIAAIRAGLVTATEEVAQQSPRQILRFLRSQLAILLPPTNYIVMQMMLQLVAMLGRRQGFALSDLSDDELDAKIHFCRKLIECLDTLNCGDCTKKGLLLYELYLANAEKHKRLATSAEAAAAAAAASSENARNLMDAFEILKDDILAPSDYRKMYRDSQTTIRMQE